MADARHLDKEIALDSIIDCILSKLDQQGKKGKRSLPNFAIQGKTVLKSSLFFRNICQICHACRPKLDVATLQKNPG